MENVELQGQSLLKSITACHVTTYYHVGAAYMALGRWPDAISTFINVLYYFLRMKQYHTRSYQYHAVSLISSSDRESGFPRGGSSSFGGASATVWK